MERPNVLVIMCDQMKAVSSHLYGNPFCRTQNLQQLADKGVLYEHAFTPHPLCAPARMALWTACYPHRTGLRENNQTIPPDYPSAFQVWKRNGYKTGVIGKNHCFDFREDPDLFDVICEIGHQGLNDASVMKGMDWGRPRESILKSHEVRRKMPWQTPVLSYSESDYPLEDYSTSVVAAQTVRFLEDHQEEPFALWVSFPDPHEPHDVPKAYADLFRPVTLQLPPLNPEEYANAPERNRVLHEILAIDNEPAEHVHKRIGAYYGMIRFLDDELGKIWTALERLNLKENTIVVFCSDHGDFAGEHGMIEKGGVFYDCLTRVPLIVSWPGHIPEGVRDGSMANLLDIVPTLFALQGIEADWPMDGRPLPTATGEKPRTSTFAEYGAGGPPFTREELDTFPERHGWGALKRSLKKREAEGERRMIRTRDWKYVHDFVNDDKDELYDMANDPMEWNNLADIPEYADMQTALKRALAHWYEN